MNELVINVTDALESICWLGFAITVLVMGIYYVNVIP